MEQRSYRGPVGLFLLIFICFLFLFGFCIYLIKQWGGSASDELSSVSSEVIAVVEMKGEIFDSQKVIELLQQAEENNKVKAIIVSIDSPGGAVAPSQEIFAEIERIDQKIPVYASMGSVAASGGYYVAAAARKIYASGGTLTGSIGVIIQTVDLSKLFQWANVNPEIIKAGKYKDVGGPHRPLSEEERKMMEATVADVHQQFIDDIVKKRKNRIKGDIHQYAQGQVFTGKQAKEYGLVDELMGLWSCGRAIHKELGLRGKFKMVVMKTKKRPSLSDFMQYVDDTKSFFSGITTYSKIPLLRFNQY